MSHSRISALLRTLLVMGVAAAALLGLPHVAQASSFTVDRVDIEATVGTDGSLSVSEQRTYAFDGSFNGIFWDIPRGSYEGQDVNAVVDSVAVIADGQPVMLEEGAGGAAGTYEVIEEPDCLRLKIYWPASDETVAFRVASHASNLALRWDDTGELYWQYVPADENSDGEWTNITATVHLPVPAGETVVPGENVRAWAHGPLDGTVSFEGTDVVLFSPGVGSEEFLETRIAFPESWLADASRRDGARLDTILAEEEQWAREANRQRRTARMYDYGVPGVMGICGIGSIIATLVHKARSKRTRFNAQFTDTYFRDVPSNDHPAVLGMLYKDGGVGGNDFTATLMRLADEGRLGLDAVWYDKKGKRGSTKRVRDWRLLKQDGAAGSRAGATRRSGSAIDDAAYSFLFDVVGAKHKELDPALMGPLGEPYVLPQFFEDVAKKSPKAFETGYLGWEHAVRSAYDSRGFEVSSSDTGSLVPGLLGLADIAVAVIFGFVGMFAGVGNVPLTIALIFCFGAGIFCIMQFDDSPQKVYSQEAMELRAKLEALKRWLTDFTRLDEALPTDVVLWNRLLMMATVLGVAKEVIEQLRVALPHIIANPGLSAYGWFADGSDHASPARAVADSLDHGKVASAGKLHRSSGSSHSYRTSSTSDSSSSGGGGGFSGGGGGGFSGGGRGGAF